MSKLVRRTLLPAIALSTILFLLIIETSKQPNDSLYDASSHIFDSISHFTFPTDNNINQAPSQPLLTEKVKPDNVESAEDKAKEKEKKKEEEKEKEKEKALDPCTVYNPRSQGFIDLRELSSISNEGKALPWIAKGYDSGKNYTLGICSNPFKKQHNEVHEIQDKVNSSLIGGYYIDSKTNKYVSIGQYATNPVFRGRKLTLTYENGSYCDAVDSRTNARLRKSTILTFTCDREMSARALVSFIGQSNECTYFFEVRSHHACPTAPKSNNLAAVWIFVLIFLAAILVYFSGGVLYRQMKRSSTDNRSKV
ncbi:Mannose 6-phosphate receptor-like protein 1 [Candida viswanathii]|uniref:Mannose 6-phosphate receptor-like protein 1 n=1 Tax=Candida viswanathii TaxID=5486 RepID=A0A367XQE5_9ASCO|nr:Mannose 6-phosphate receptor-like protein 1 [Candida viswanathii]